MNTAIAWLRGLRLVIHLVVGLVLAAAVRIDLTRRLSGPRLMHWWTGMLLEILNIRLFVSGQPATGARFTVANHVSWLDIPLIGACEPTHFLSKSEVRDWPVAGMLAEAAGTFYIRRGKGGARPLLNLLVPHLKAGGNITVFPEGTTTDGRDVLPFHSRLFGAAIEAGCPVQPVAIRYGHGPDGAAVAPFIGDDDLISHILRVLRTPELVAEVTYCRPIYPQGQDRDSLCAAAQAAVRDRVSPGLPLAELPLEEPAVA
jgi:1-acyl-sn-glycerol-3-phosphate acyltransferase